MNEDYVQNSGSVFLEIKLTLKSDSGRAKHMDLDGQGYLVAHALWTYLQEELESKDFTGIDVPELIYWGINLPKTIEGPKTFKN